VGKSVYALRTGKRIQFVKFPAQGNRYFGQRNFSPGNDDKIPGSGGFHPDPSGSRTGGPGLDCQMEAEKQEINPQIFSR
jgi:hypothetical protein